MTEMSYAGADTARSPDQPTTDGVKEKAREVTSEVGEKARDLRGQASSRVHDEVDSRSTQAGEQVTSMADALRRTGGQLREEGKSSPAGLAEGAADRIEGLGTYLRDSDADRILADVEDFARRRPWIVGAGGLVLGLLTSRLLKASSSRRYESGGSSSWSYASARPGRYGELPPADEPIARADVGV